jgi:hypothetical protein
MSSLTIFRDINVVLDVRWVILDVFRSARSLRAVVVPDKDVVFLDNVFD